MKKSEPSYAKTIYNTCRDCGKKDMTVDLSMGYLTNPQQFKTTCECGGTDYLAMNEIKTKEN